MLRQAAAALGGVQTGPAPAGGPAGVPISPNGPVPAAGTGEIISGYTASLTLGAGQVCTDPGR
ncbi:hypothetical protein GCM10009736_10520 [Actinomadura bangladeshensis]